jgi:phosphoserine phosphatase
MTHFLVVLSDPSRPSVDHDALIALQAAVPNPAAPRWLSEGIAAEIPFVPAAPLAPAERKRLAARGRDTLSGRPLDVAVIPAAARRKRLLLADMDSTMIRQECIDELAAELGLKAHIAAITERAMRGEIAFEPALRERVALLKGLPAGVVDKVIAERIVLMPGGRALVATMRANGAYTALVSGGFTVFTGPIGRMIGFDEDRSNTLDMAGGQLAGTVREPILGQQAKLDALIELRERFGLAPEDTLAVGDGANDLAMLGGAGLGVALHAKPKVADAAEVRIDHGDLTALLYLQGYDAAAFAV